MADEITLWSNELARNPGSTAFVHLGDALRRQGQLDMALKVVLRGLERHPHRADAHDLLARIAIDRGDLQRAIDEWDAVLRLDPTHLGALKGLSYICFLQGRTEDAERYLQRAAGQGEDTGIGAALANVRRSSGPMRAMTSAGDDDDPRRLFADLLTDGEQTALLLDSQGLVLAGLYVGEDGRDVSQEIGAQLSGVPDEAERAARYLELGDWRSIVVETDVAVVAMMPAGKDGLVVFAASRATPLGLLRRLLDRCGERARSWLEARR
jgi:tetratricopeptide (TPR) repeat protein